MAFRHGVYTSELPTSILPARSVDSNVVFAVGTAAVDRLETGKPRYVNRLRMYYSYDEFVSEMGWDEENFNKYSLQELAYSHFALYRGAPLVVCNVFDPAVHKTSVSSEAVSFDAKGAASLKHGSVSKLVLKNAESSTTYVEGTDYTLDPISGELSRIEGGSLPAEANVTAGYDYADVSLVDSTDVIGGINESTGESEGLELIDSVFPQFRLVPGSILAPRFSEDPAVAVVMAAKADGINGLFKAVALADIPTEGEHGVKKYTDVPAYKQNNNLSDELLIVCWPKVKLGDRVFGLATHLAGLISQTDADREGVQQAAGDHQHRLSRRKGGGRLEGTLPRPRQVQLPERRGHLHRRELGRRHEVVGRAHERVSLEHRPQGLPGRHPPILQLVPEHVHPDVLPEGGQPADPPPDPDHPEKRADPAGRLCGPRDDPWRFHLLRRVGQPGDGSHRRHRPFPPADHPAARQPRNRRHL